MQEPASQAVHQRHRHQRHCHHDGAHTQVGVLVARQPFSIILPDTRAIVTPKMVLTIRFGVLVAGTIQNHPTRHWGHSHHDSAHTQVGVLVARQPFSIILPDTRAIVTPKLVLTIRFGVLVAGTIQNHPTRQWGLSHHNRAHTQVGVLIARQPFSTILTRNIVTMMAVTPYGRFSWATMYKPF